MSSVNKVILVGHTGKDPEIRYLPNGDAVANLSLATSEVWKDKTGAKQEKTEWHRVSFFGRLAEICEQYIHKGSLLYIEGSISTRKYNDKDGIERYATEIKGRELQMLGNKPQSDDQSRQGVDSQQQKQTQPAPSAAPSRPVGGGGFEDMDDDIPFRDPLANKAFAMCVC